jgi:hypothetical protein
MVKELFDFLKTNKAGIEKLGITPKDLLSAVYNSSTPMKFVPIQLKKQNNKNNKNIESSDENSCDTWWYDQLDIKIGCDDIDDVKIVSHENHCESN